MKRKKVRQGAGRGQARQPLIRLIAVDAAIATASLAGPAAMATPGDLDPAFGDVGRQAGIESNLWTSLTSSIDVAGDDSVLFGGGGEFVYYGTYEDYFIGALRPDGTPDPGFVAPQLGGTVIRDTALQSDGKVVGVGRTRAPDGSLDLQVFRVLRNGTLDSSFGIGGLATIDSGTANSVEGHAVAIDPDGRIVVAGFRGLEVFVARFLENGTLDPAFGTAGIYSQGFPAGAVQLPLRLVRAAGGGYRVLAHHVGAASGGDGCGIRALTDGGAVDATFGQAGVATVRGPGAVAVFCHALAVQLDGKLLVGGTEQVQGGGFVGRILPGGAPDGIFDASGAAAKFDSVRAVATGPGGTILAAGGAFDGLSGALVARLGVNGTLDPAYGKAGATRVEFASTRPATVSVGDLKVLSDGRVVVAGDAEIDWSKRVFVARLLGDVGAGPGVLGLQEGYLTRTEQQGTAALTVLRSGGRAGATAVTYTARALDGSNVATPGSDFTAVTGRLTWADGDDGPRTIVVPIVADAVDEPPEFFEVVLTAPEGGAGLGTSGADVEIAGSGYPFGIFTIRGLGAVLSEGTTATFFVTREYYGQGAASITVRLVSGGTATPGKDFANSNNGQSWQDVVLSWQNGEWGPKQVNVILRQDRDEESEETFTLELASPTGSASIGSQNSVTTAIRNVVPSGSGNGNGAGGSGSWGGFGALLLALAGMMRRLRGRTR